MRMIPTRSTSLLIILFTLTGVAVRADDDASPTITKAGLDWPRTFSGQPDFAFTREEVLRDAKGRASESSGGVAALMPNLKDLLDDDTKLDPLHLAGVASTTTVSATADVSGTDTSELSLMDKLLSNVSALPTFNTSYTVNVTEFTGTLNRTISATVEHWQPRVGSYSYGGMADSLILQAIVTSPEKYAIINGQRYAEGDSFQIKAEVPVPEDIITSALQSKIPPSGTVPVTLYQQYKTIYQSVVDAFSKTRAVNPGIGQQTLVIPVTVQSIQPRLVKLNLNGEEHDLAIKVAY